jgi:hypothetical protein
MASKTPSISGVPTMIRIFIAFVLFFVTQLSNAISGKTGSQHFVNKTFIKAIFVTSTHIGAMQNLGYNQDNSTEMG